MSVLSRGMTLPHPCMTCRWTLLSLSRRLRRRVPCQGNHLCKIRSREERNFGEKGNASIPFLLLLFPQNRVGTSQQTPLPYSQRQLPHPVHHIHSQQRPHPQCQRFPSRLFRGCRHHLSRRRRLLQSFTRRKRHQRHKWHQRLQCHQPLPLLPLPFLLLLLLPLLFPPVSSVLHL